MRLNDLNELNELNGILQNVSSTAALEQVCSAAKSTSVSVSEEMLSTRFPENARDNASGEINLTVPIYVDGMKLGEAAIRGINAVTRATGKLQLNI